MGDTRVMSKCATAARLCAVPARCPFQVSAMKKSPSFDFCQVDMYTSVDDHHPYGNEPPLPSLHSYHFLADLHFHDDINMITPSVSSCVQHLVSHRHLPCPVSFPLRLLHTHSTSVSSSCPLLSTPFHPSSPRSDFPPGLRIRVVAGWTLSRSS